MKIILLGHRGSGKTTLSKKLHAQLHLPILRRYTDKQPKGHDAKEEYCFIPKELFDELKKEEKIYYGQYKESRFGVDKSLPLDWIACLSFGEILSMVSDFKNESFLLIYTYLEKKELWERLNHRGLTVEKINKTIEEDEHTIEQIERISKLSVKKRFQFSMNKNRFTFLPYNTSDSGDDDIIEHLSMISTETSLPFYDLNYLNKLLPVLNHLFL